MRREQISAGNGGWVLFQSLEPDITAWVRFSDRNGRLVITELYLVDDNRLETDSLRALPLGRIDAWVNGEAADEVRASLDMPSPDLRRAATYWATWLNPEKERNQHWVTDMLAAQVKGSGVRQAPMGKVAPVEPVESLPDAALDVPAGGDYGDDFYREVAWLYQLLARAVRAPAKALAEANDVPVTTARRWVKEARARGFLPAGRAGKAG